LRNGVIINNNKGIDLVDLRDFRQRQPKFKRNLNYDSDGLKDIRR